MDGSREIQQQTTEDFLGEERRSLLPLLIPPLVHRLNNSLTVLHAAGELGSSGSGSEAAEREFRAARSALGHLTILARTHDESGPATFDLGEVLRGVEVLLTPCAEALGVALRCSPPAGTIASNGDPALLEQLVLVLVADELMVLARERLSAARAAPPPTMRVTVSQSGSRIAVRLARARIQGRDDAPTALWRKAADWLEPTGATVYLRSIGEASCYRIVFPAAVEEAGEAAHGPSRDERLLLAEDDEPLRELIATVLTEAGYRVNTLEGVQLVAGELAATAADLILLDADVELAQPSLMAELEAVPGLAERLLFLGAPHAEPRAVPVLPKPFRPHELLAAVRARLDAPAGTPA